MAEALSLASGQKGAIAEYYSSNNQCPKNNTSTTAGGIASPSKIAGKYVLSVTTGDASGGTITLGSATITPVCQIDAKMRNTGVNGDIAGGTLSLKMGVTSGAFQWGCSSADIDDKYLPSTCQK
ncbi:pilin [Entomomonas sp. E2T0]|nr:pilin [Entomomonas sp. E2T0]